MLTRLAIIILLVLRAANVIHVLIEACHVGALDDGGAPNPIIRRLFLHHGLDDKVYQIVDDLLAHHFLLGLDLAVCQLRGVLNVIQLRGVALGHIVQLV